MQPGNFTDTTTSTKIVFVVQNPKLVHLKVQFYLDAYLIQELPPSYFIKAKERSVSLDVTNIARGAQHTITVVLLNNHNQNISKAQRTTWFLEDWRDLSRTEDGTVCPATKGGDRRRCSSKGPVNDFAAPFFVATANVFSKPELSRIVQFTKQKHALYTASTVGEREHVDGQYRRTQKLIVQTSPGLMQMIYTRLERVAKVINARNWKFNLSSDSSSDSSLDSSAAAAAPCRAHENLQFLLYTASDQGFYDWHLDRGVYGSSAKRKLSMTVQLTDGYEGGQLDVMTGRSFVSLPKQAGVVSLFPSYMLHRVTPVTKGTREAIVLWFTGCEGFK